MKRIIKFYTNARQRLFARTSWNRFYKFVQLPELKIVKTLGFLAGWLL